MYFLQYILYKTAFIQINNLEEYEKYKPGKIKEIQNWFINIKTYDGKKKSQVFQNGRLFGIDETLKIIQDTHKEWIKLKQGTMSNDQNYNKKFQEKRAKFHMI